MRLPSALYIDGRARAGSGGAIVVDDPSNGHEIATLACATPAQIDEAVTAAAAAARAWGERPAHERAGLCRRVAELIRADRDRLVELDVRDAGLPLRLARADVEAAARYFEYHAGVAEHVSGTTLPPDASGVRLTLREPWGVCAIILPFNLPLQLAARDVAPAVATGNSVVVKPAEQAPFGPLALVELMHRVEAPGGVVNAISGGADVGAQLVRHTAVDHITFTGSRRAGSAVMADAARRVVPTTIELGGKSPQIVFADADLDAATDAIVRGCMPAAGQACSAGTRVLVSADRRDQLYDRLGAAIRSLTVGPAAGDPDVGPLISARQRDLVQAAVADAERHGARVLVGQDIPECGYFVSPTILDTVDPSAAAAQQEIFGPVLTVLEFENEEEAVAIANGTDYGLLAGVWTRDLARAVRVTRALKAGQVHVNGYAVGGGTELPFGGYKRSGVGRVKGLAGALEYTQLKTVVLNAGGSTP